MSYLEKCIQSILKQKTKFSYCTVFVDDGSTDGSSEILNQYCNQKNVTVIHQKNKGISSARNMALRKIYGRYVMFVDSDDYLPEYAVEQLLNIAVQYQADIVEGGYQQFEQELQGKVYSHGKQICQVSSDILYGYPWGKVISGRFFIDLCFPENYQFEDTIMATLLYPSCERIFVVPETVYFYRQNEKGITATSQLRKDAVDTFWMTQYCMQEHIKRGFKLSENDYNKFLSKIRLNWMRIQNMPTNIKIAVWILTCQLYKAYFATMRTEGEEAMRMLENAILYESYQAYEFIMENWWQFQ